MILKGLRNKYISFIFLLSIIFYLAMYWNIKNSTKCMEYLEIPYANHKVRLKPVHYSFEIKNLSDNDYRKLVDIEDFSFLILNKHACDTKDMFLLILVPSSPNHIEHRVNIRSTWGYPKNGVKLLFLLGIVTDKRLQEQIETESKVHNDIIQGNFIDTYHNITYKSVMSLKYVVYHCPKALYILKVDDDSFVNTPLLLNFLKNDLSPYGAANLFLCNDMSGSPVIRDNRSRWYVPEDVYSESVYPSYCSGWYAIFSPDICFQLYQHSQNLKYLFVEDAFLYGIAASEANLQHTDISKFTLTGLNPNFLFDGRYDKIPILFGSPNMNIELIKKFWDYFRNKPVVLSIRQNIL